MKIRIETRSHNDDDEVELESFDSLEELESSLFSSATEDYANEVLGRIKSGEISFSIANGSDIEFYQIEG